MAADLATLAIHVDADKATQSVQHFGHESEKSALSVEMLESAAEGLETGFAKLRTVVGLGLFGYEFVQTTIAAQDSMAQLQAGVKSTGGAAGFTAEQLRKQAYEMEELTTSTHVAAEQTQGILLLFQRLSGEEFEKAELATANLAARLRTDMPDAARQLGRALEDPANGLMMLRRAGIVFSDGQREMLKDMVNTGHQAEAQAIILDELDKKLAGSAAAARDTLGGALKGVTHDFENLFEVSRDGSSGVISTLNNIGSGLRFLREHAELLRVAVLAGASAYAGKFAAALSTTITAQIASADATILAAAKEVERTRTLAAESVALQENAAWEVRLSEQVLKNAQAHEQCAYTEQQRAAGLAELSAAEARLIAAEEAEVTATIAVTDAQLAETAAAVAATAASSRLALAMGVASGAASTLWKAIGGPIGAVIIGIMAAKYAFDKWMESVENAAKQTDAQSEATDRALAAERKRNTALRQAAEDTESARIAAEKANRERDAETSKLKTLNSAYMGSTLALKVLELQLSANIEKVKAHKDVKQAEWAAIDKSIDALTREQVAQVKLAAAKKTTENLTALRASNEATLTAAESTGRLQTASNGAARAQLENADAYERAQNSLEHLKNQIDAAAQAEDAWATFKRSVVGATQQEIRAAKEQYDTTIAGIGATRHQRDENADANTVQEHSNRLMAEGKQLREDMNALVASNAAAAKSIEDNRRLADAEADVTRARFLGGQAVTESQRQLEHLQAALDAENEVTAAGVTLKKASTNATEDQIRAAKLLYDETVRGIEQTHQLKDANIDASIAANTLADARSKAYDLVHGFFDDARNGATAFWDHFKQAAENAFAELIEKRLIDKLLNSSPAFASLFGGMSGGSGGITASNLFNLPTASGARAAQIGQGIGIAGAGFGVGAMVGGMTENRGLAALGGAASGAATGAAIGAMGGPIGVATGAIIGGAAGLVGGFFGAKKAAEDLGKTLFGISSGAMEIATSLADWRAQITGTAEDQAKANAADLRWKYLQLVQTIEQVEAGKKNEEQREKDLKEAAELYAEAQKNLTKSANDLNQAFTGMIGAVTGYKLNLQLFNFSPSLPPGGNGSNTGTGSGNSNGSGSNGSGTGNGNGNGSGTTDGGGGAITGNRDFIVQLVLDGKVIARSTVNQLRNVSQENFGTSDRIAEAMTLL